MNIISIQKHFLTPEITAAWNASAVGSQGIAVFGQGEIGERIKNLGDGRLPLMVFSKDSLRRRMWRKAHEQQRTMMLFQRIPGRHLASSATVIPR